MHCLHSPRFETIKKIHQIRYFTKCRNDKLEFHHIYKLKILITMVKLVSVSHDNWMSILILFWGDGSASKWDTVWIFSKILEESIIKEAKWLKYPLPTPPWPRFWCQAIHSNSWNRKIDLKGANLISAGKGLNARDGEKPVQMVWPVQTGGGKMW
jgi:hypothetical protein